MKDLGEELHTTELFLPYLASCAHDHIGRDAFANGRLAPDDELFRVWNQFFNNIEVQKLGEKALAIFNIVRAESLRAAVNESIAVDDLAAAHQNAHEFISDILKKNGLDLPLDPASLVVSFDENARTFCASTSRILGQVRWVYQPVPHALYGALIPEIILAHEYLSHLAPQNAFLGDAVTENWLVVALMRSLRESWGNDRSQVWKNMVWALMRDALENHVRSLKNVEPARSVLKFGSPRGVKEFALILYGRSKPAFWRFTAALLAPSYTTSFQINQLFRDMIADEEDFINTIKSRNPLKIEDLYGVQSA